MAISKICPLINSTNSKYYFISCTPGTDIRSIITRMINDHEVPARAAVKDGGKVTFDYSPI